MIPIDTRKRRQFYRCEKARKIKNEKIKEFKEKADKYQQLFKGTYLIEKSDNQWMKNE